MKILILLLITTTTLAAGEIKREKVTLGSNTYQGCTITLVTPSTARILHSSGIKRIPASTLPEDIRKELGYNKELDLKHSEQAKKKAAADRANAKKRAAEKKLLASAKKERLWVVQNRENGLVVGHFDERYERSPGSSNSRIGGGGTGGGLYTVYSKNYKYAFIPHTATTKKLTVDYVFTAKVTKIGTHRLNSSTVIPKYRLLKVITKK